MRATRKPALAVTAGLLALVGCGGERERDAGPLPEVGTGNALEAFLNEPWTGDLDGMLERGLVRILTVYHPLHFTYDGVEPRGITVETARLFEERLNRTHGRKGHPVSVILVPVDRDELLPGLREGRGDVAIADLTITPARKKLVAFSNPVYRNVREVLVTGPAAPDVASFDDLVGTPIWVRPSSSYREHLDALNARRAREGKAELVVRDADERLGDWDLLELVNAGILPAVVSDSHRARLWAQVYDEIRVHMNLAVQTGGSLAWAVRKGSPQLLAQVNAIVAETRKGTLLGNVLIERYYGDRKWVDNALADGGRSGHDETLRLIQRYSAQYGFDWRMIAAQGYQESKLDQRKRSPAGAVGIMQILPRTAADPKVGIKDIHEPDGNIHAGTKYMRFLRDRYFSAEDVDPVDRVLFSLAAYNAGPANVRRARQGAARMGLDPNRWFRNVEVAMARTIGREPVTYVRNVYKYYIAYQQLGKRRVDGDEAPERLG